MSDIFRHVSNALAATVEIASPGVVRLEARRRLPATGIVWSADGLVVTAHHVVEKDDAIRVGLPDGQTVSASLVGRDPTTDLAVVRTQNATLAPPTWAEMADLRVGHLVVALGRPGQNVQATLGIVSVLEDSWRTPVGGHIEQYVQTDVVMYPGFSGGPLVDADGRFLGLNTSALRRGMSLTIPVSTLRRVVAMLLAHGRVRRGYLGVSTQPVRLPAALADQLGQETGLLVTTVEPESPAARGGLLLGDALVSMDGMPIRQHDDFLALMTADRIGSTVPLRIVRSGQLQDVPVVIGERTEGQAP